MSFSATSSALEGFRLVGRKPGSFLLWCCAYLALLIVVGVVVFATVGAGLVAAFQSGGPGAPDPLAISRAVTPVMFLFYPITFIWTSIFYCAIYRAVLRPEEKGFGYLKLGGDELRMMGAVLLLIVAALVVVFVVGLVFGLLAAVLAKPLGAFALLIDVLAAMALFCVYIWAVVRLSLYLPQTFAERRIDLPKAWRLTRGHFWGLVGMFLLDLIIVCGMVLAGYFVVFLLIGGAFLGMASGQHPHFDSGSAVMALIGGLLALALYFVMPTLMAVVMMAPFASAYRALTPQPDAAEVFS
jgi:hypothetical protein